MAAERTGTSDLSEIVRVGVVVRIVF